MDTTKEYIEQCEKAEEIQPCLNNEDGVGGTWVYGNILYHTAPMNQPHDRVGYYHVTDEMAVRRCKECGNEKDYIKSSKAIWLPQQDQLQDMIKSECPLALFLKFYRWMDLTDIAGFDDSMEQLWLAFVMKEKYNKVWDGNEWQNS